MQGLNTWLQLLLVLLLQLLHSEALHSQAAASRKARTGMQCTVPRTQRDIPGVERHARMEQGRWRNGSNEEMQIRGCRALMLRYDAFADNHSLYARLTACYSDAESPQGAHGDTHPLASVASTRLIDVI